MSALSAHSAVKGIILFVCPSINIVYIFSWDLLWSQDKIKAILMQNFGRPTKSIMVYLKVAYLKGVGG